MQITPFYFLEGMANDLKQQLKTSLRCYLTPSWIPSGLFQLILTSDLPKHNQTMIKIFSFDNLLPWWQENKPFLYNKINLVIYHYFILSCE